MTPALLRPPAVDPLETYALVSDAIYAVDEGWRLTYVNAAAERAAGRPAEKLLGQDIWRLYPDSVGGALWDAHQRVMTCRQAEQVQAHSRLIGREVRGWLRPTEDGGLLVVLQDIEAQRRAETRRDAAEADLRQVLESVTDGFYSLSADWRIVLFNRAAEQFFKRQRQEVLGRVFWEVFPASGTRIEAEFREVARTGRPSQFEFRSTARPGRVVEMRAARRDDGGLAVSFTDITERAEMEAALEASEAMLRKITDAMPVLISYIDREERFRFANKAYEGRFGRDLDQIIGRTLREVFGEAVYRARQPYVARALAGEHVQYEVEFPTREAVLTTLVDNIPDVAADGTVLGIYALVQDITPLRRAEAALRESEARLELATAASALGVWEWRLESGEMIFSARAREIWGFAPGETVTVAALRDRTHPEDVDEVAEQSARAFDPAVREREPYRYRIRRPDGETRWVRAHGAAVFDETAGAPRAVRYVGTMEDVTDQQVMQDELARSAARLRLAVDAGRMAVWAVDAEGGVVSSPELNRMVGLPADATPSLEELQAQYAPGELERMQQLAIETIARGDRFFEVEYRHIRANDGAVRWLLVRAEFQFGPDGAPLGSLGVVLDITDRKAAEERLKLLAREVDHRANNLLTVVQGAIALTRASTLESYRETLEGRVAALARAHQLLAGSRWTGADLRTLVTEELRPYQTAAARITVEGPSLELAPDVAQSVAMVVHELATNAIKHGALSTGAGALDVRWSPAEGGGACQLVWDEHGGPSPAPAPGRRKGLGMQVLARALSGAIGGRTELEWRPEGLRCTLAFPLRGEAAPRS